jgi:hypothetical protein
MHNPFRILAVCVLVAISGAACTSSGGLPIPPITAPGGGSGGGSSGSGGDPGVGIDPPVVSGPGGPAPIGPPRATIVTPKPGRLDAHPVGAGTIEASVTGRKVAVRLTWWSGVAPCSVLDSIDVARTGSAIVLTIREGADQRGVACIDLAMLKGAIVDLGELTPGSYTISAGGEAPPVQVVVD